MWMLEHASSGNESFGGFDELDCQYTSPEREYYALSDRVVLVQQQQYLDKQGKNVELWSGVTRAHDFFLVSSGILIFMPMLNWSPARPSPSKQMPIVWPRRWGHSAPSHWLCVCKTVLVFSFASCWTLYSHPTSNRTLLGGLVDESRSCCRRWQKERVEHPHPLGAWTIWRHRNDCVFNGATPRRDTSLLLAKEEVELWCLAGAKGLSLLTAKGGLLGAVCFGPVISFKISRWSVYQVFRRCVCVFGSMYDSFFSF